jgi:DNA-binding Lrp family transcriptional regulator
VPEFDALDKKIYDLLAEDGRMSNLEVAGRVGVSEKTVRQRLRRMIERDGLRIRATLDHEAAPSRLIVLVRAKSGQRFAVADSLAALPEVDDVHLTTGAWELIVLASFDSDSDALEFYVSHIEQALGIEASSSTHVIETINPRATRRSDHLDQFDAKATAVGSLTELLDLTCDFATTSLGADRVHVATGESWLAEPARALSTTTLRWRGLSSRYVEEIVKRRAESAVTSNVIEHAQHLFVADAQTDPMFQSVADLVLTEGYHSWLTVPVRDRDTRRGTLTMYWDTIIPHREQLVVQAQELADTLGKHLASYETTSDGVEVTQPATPTRPRAGRRASGQ